MNVEEGMHIAAGIIVISLAFTFVQLHGSIQSTSFSVFFHWFGFSLLTVGMGFVLHELAHKYIAIRYGAHAEFRSWNLGLFLALFLSVMVGVVFAAPGAVYIFGPHLNRRQNGWISLAGPLTNMALAIFFFAISFIHGFAELGTWGAAINIWLGLFNMIPIFPLDGSKVVDWDWRAWLITSLVFVGMFLGISGVFA